jgi:arylsulfatase
MATKKPNILIIWGDDIGIWNISHFSRGMMGYRTPNMIASRRKASPSDFYGQQAPRPRVFHHGQNPIRTGLTKVGMPGATVGLQARIRRSPRCSSRSATPLVSSGRTTSATATNLPTVHGFDEFFGNLYHLNAEKSRSCPTIPKDPAFKKELVRAAFCTASPTARADRRSRTRVR